MMSWKRFKPAMYLMPALLFIGIFIVYPVGRTLFDSLWNGNLLNPHREFVLAAHFSHFIQDPGFHRILVQSCIYLCLMVVGVFLVPVVLGLFTLELSKQETGVCQTVLFVPTVIAANVAVTIWIWFFNPTGGLFNELQELAGLESLRFLKDGATVIPSVSLVAAWKQLGFHYLIVLAGLKSIPVELVDAAKVDGAGFWSTVFRIRLPLFGPTALFLFIVTLIQGMDYTFVPIDILTAGGPAGASSNLMYSIYQEGLKSFRVGVASAQSVVLIFLFGGIIFLQYRMLDRRVKYER